MILGGFLSSLSIRLTEPSYDCWHSISTGFDKSSFSLELSTMKSEMVPSLFFILCRGLYSHAISPSVLYFFTFNCTFILIIT